jgi:hypothetical protein
MMMMTGAITEPLAKSLTFSLARVTGMKTPRRFAQHRIDGNDGGRAAPQTGVDL